MSFIKINVVRGNSEAGKESAEYEVPYQEGMSLLDAILWIREFEDSSLSVRYSCRSANACKECLAVVDGKIGFLCSIRAKEGSTTQIEPLKTQAWVQDLVTNMD